jgi:hypothetical protein
MGATADAEADGPSAGKCLSLNCHELSVQASRWAGQVLSCFNDLASTSRTHLSVRRRLNVAPRAQQTRHYEKTIFVWLGLGVSLLTASSSSRA